MFIRGITCLVLITNVAVADRFTIGDIGIKSIGLLDAQGVPLDGDGVAVGQVEPHRPGDEQAGDGATFRNNSIDPTAVFYRDGPSMPEALGSVMNHGSWVAGTLISTDMLHRGVVPAAELYSTAMDPILPNPPQPLSDTVAALSAQHIANQNGGDVRVTNMSFSYPIINTNPILDGNQLLCNSPIGRLQSKTCCMSCRIKTRPIQQGLGFPQTILTA